MPDCRRLTRLYCMNGGHHLQILADGTVQGQRDDRDVHSKAAAHCAFSIQGRSTAWCVHFLYRRCVRLKGQEKRYKGARSLCGNKLLTCVREMLLVSCLDYTGHPAVNSVRGRELWQTGTSWAKHVGKMFTVFHLMCNQETYHYTEYIPDSQHLLPKEHKNMSMSIRIYLSSHAINLSTLCGVCMFSLCLHGFTACAPAFSHCPDTHIG